MSHDKIQPVILSGGSGTRLWPLSREDYPKQLLSLTSNYSMIQETAKRFTDSDQFEAPLIICNESHRFIIAEQMLEVGIQPRNIILEPVGRNTAPAIAVAALMVADDPDAVLFIMPSDHIIQDPSKLRPALEQARNETLKNAIITFGLTANKPETGYGYIQHGSLLLSGPNFYNVKNFMEKPNEKMAEKLIKEGDCFWNSGMFLFKAKQYLAELEIYYPEVIDAARRALAEGEKDIDFFRLNKEAFETSPSISIDHAIMEHTKNAVVVETDITWNDVGSWAALYDIGKKDNLGNVIQGDVDLHDVHNSYIRSDAGLVAAVGLNDTIIVATEDVVFFAPKDRAQEVRFHVSSLKAQCRVEVIEHKTVYRPWGHYRTIQTGHRFQVKQITVKPGAKLSLQMHHHRAEHWIVVTGTALVTRDDETLLLTENESTYIPLGTKHRLENPGKVALDLIEVQSGAYLGEDDIIRFEDQYGRDRKNGKAEMDKIDGVVLPAE